MSLGSWVEARHRGLLARPNLTPSSDSPGFDNQEMFRD